MPSYTHTVVQTLAVYHYPEEKKSITIGLTRSGLLSMRDEKGDVPYCKAIGQRVSMRDDTQFQLDVPGYEEVGLFYGYSMDNLGWG